MASGATIGVFTPLHAQLPASGNAVLDTVNGQQIIKYVTAVDTSAIFNGVMPRNYSGGTGIAVTLYWGVDTTVAAKNCVWKVDFERQNLGRDYGSDHFDTADAQSNTAAIPGTNTIVQTTEIDFSTAQADGIAAGDAFRVRVQRNASNVSDTFANNCQLLGAELKDR